MPTRAERVEQVVLLGVGRERRRERAGAVVAEQRRPEHDPGRQLADDGGKPQTLGELRPQPGRGHQQRQLHEQQEHGVARQARDGGMQSRSARSMGNPDRRRSGGDPARLPELIA